MMRFFYIVLVVIFSCQSVCAREIERPDTYNYNRGMEALSENKEEEAIEFFNKELNADPKNGYAYYWISCIRSNREEYGKALTAANLALKHLPKKDKEFVSYAFASRAGIYRALEEEDKALLDYGEAILNNPDEEEWYEKRGQLLYEQKKYDLADKDYEKIIALNEGSVMGYMGLGRNAQELGLYDRAMEQFNYVIKLAPSYSSGYSFRAETYLKQGKWNDAAQDMIKAIGLDGDEKARYLLHELADSSLVTAVNKLKIEAAKQPNNSYWPYCLGEVYEGQEQFKNAIEHYNEAFKLTGNPAIACRLALCYGHTGQYTQALERINYAIGIDSTDHECILYKADVLYEMGEQREAIDEMGKYVSKNPDFFYGYYRRGFFKDNSGDVQGAIDDYSMAITQNPNYAYAYLGRADMYVRLGKMKMAEEDCRRVIQLDTVPANSACAQYAYLQLGEKEKAIDFMNRVIAQDKEEANNYYDAACLYARMKDSKRCLYYLEEAFKKGYSRFNHLMNDDDLDLVKNDTAFIHLYGSYKAEYDQKNVACSEGAFVERVVEVPFVKDGEVLKVKCKINNLPLFFIFDTGASDVSMSNVEASFMLKNDYLLQDDVLGKQNYLTADGSISEGTVVNLRNVEFGVLQLSNIAASIVKNQKAPLLLGQSVLKRLGNIEIDNERRVIKITYRCSINK